MLRVMNSAGIEKVLERLDREERGAIVYRGILFRLPELNARLERAKRKIEDFEEKYQTTSINKLPDDASYKYHEDYIEWKHWMEVSKKLYPLIRQLESMLSLP
ncbi:hypothetical protein KJ693_10615 [bacterium]|nr:hypothetical protein [bacterium]MBU1615742.1 hypothetical protein [bacterium]